MPILFGVLRKEQSLLMIYQALGSRGYQPHLHDPVQIITFLLFLTFYVPCLSTFVMMRALGRKNAFFSVALSVGVALLTAGAPRLLLTLLTRIA